MAHPNDPDHGQTNYDALMPAGDNSGKLTKAQRDRMDQVANSDATRAAARRVDANARKGLDAIGNPLPGTAPPRPKPDAKSKFNHR